MYKKYIITLLYHYIILLLIITKFINLNKNK